MNNMYHFLKEFRCGVKAGKISKHPAAKIIAPDEVTAWNLFKEHPKNKKNAKYVCRDIGLAGAEEMDSGGQKKPGEWTVGDKCWTRLNPWDLEDSFHPAKIQQIHEFVPITEEERKINVLSSLGFTVWILGDWASLRFRRAESLLLQPPKGKRRRKRQRPAKKRRGRKKKT